jgi:hypothetical protein
MGTEIADSMRTTGGRVRAIRGRLLLAGAALALLSVSGCGEKRLEVAPVRGKVVYNGQGVPQATVIFFPVDPVNDEAAKMRPFAYAELDGQFQLKTYVAGDGAPPGKYRVSIIAPMGAPSTSSKDRPVDDQPAAAGTGVRVPPAIVKKYANVDTSGIEVQIQEGENNLEPFELTM